MIRYDGQKAGVYRDLNDNVTILDITCTQYGHGAHFNDAEKTWDCPPHAGGTTRTENFLEGPPKDSLKVLFRGKWKEPAGRTAGITRFRQ